MNLHVVVLTLMSSIFAASIAEAKKPQNASARAGEVRSPRSLSAIHAEVRSALRAEALARRMGDNTAEVLQLIGVYRKLAVHPQRDTSVMLRLRGQRLRARLRQVAHEIARRTAHPDRAVKNASSPSTLVFPRTHVLAQQVAPPGGAPIGLGAAGGPRDYGPDLVALIQRTISPATWDINGGGGSVVYHAPLRAIVVRAPADVHEQIGGVLGQLRADP